MLLFQVPATLLKATSTVLHSQSSYTDLHSQATGNPTPMQISARLIIASEIAVIARIS